MATAQENIASINDSTLELITTIQDRIVDVHKEFASMVSGLVPDVPSFLPQPKMPDTPDPKSLVEQGFDFRARLLEANKTFSLGLIDAWTHAAPKPPAKARASSKK